MVYQVMLASSFLQEVEAGFLCELGIPTPHQPWMLYTHLSFLLERGWVLNTVSGFFLSFMPKAGHV